MRQSSPPPGLAPSDQLGLVVGSGRSVERQVEAFLEIAPSALVFTWKRRAPAGRERLHVTSWRAVANQLKAHGVTDVVHIGVFSAADILGQLCGAIGRGVLKTLRARGGPIEAVMRPYLKALQDAGIQPQSHSVFLKAFSVGSGLLSAGGSPHDIEAEALAISHQLRPEALVQLATRQPRFSVSQAVIFEDGKLVAQESSGTDTMLRSAAKRPPKGRRVLVKLRPPQQPIGLDPPAIGPKTLRHAKRAGISGIVLDAQHGIVFDRAETLAVADMLGIWIIGV